MRYSYAHMKRIAQAHPIRTRPKWQLVRRMRDAGVTQGAIAAKVGVSQAFVSRVLARTATVRPTAKTEAIWREIEKALHEGGTA